MKQFQLRMIGCSLLLVWAAHQARAANYRVFSPTPNQVVPGQVFHAWVEVATEAGDNQVGFGYLSFAITLTMSGDVGLNGAAVSNVAINQVLFNDQGSSSTGHAQGLQYVGTAGLSTDTTPPNPGSAIGDVVRLFDFDLTIPFNAPFGSTAAIMPSEGLLQNLTVGPGFEVVSPQTFTPMTITVVPEPASLGFLVLALVMRRRRRRSFE